MKLNERQMISTNTSTVRAGIPITGFLPFQNARPWRPTSFCTKARHGAESPVAEAKFRRTFREIAPKTYAAPKPINRSPRGSYWNREATGRSGDM
jgi:hypothetical protein